MGRSLGWEQQFLPHDLGEGFLFSVPAVLLLFNLNTQPLHHSCIPERGRGLWWQLARLPAPGMTRGTSASSLLLREQSFLCAAGETREQSWAQVLKSPCGEGLSGASGFELNRPTQTGVHLYQPELLAPTLLCLISVLSAMTH